MFERLGCAAVALGIAAACLPALGQERIEPALEHQPIPERREDSGADQGQNQTNQQAEDADRLIAAINAIVSAVRDLKPDEDATERERQSQNQEDDLQAQQDMALWAERMFWATTAAVFVTTVGVYLIWRTLIYTRRAAEAAVVTVDEARKSTAAAVKSADAAVDANNWLKRSSIFEQRAWLHVSDVQLVRDLRWKGDSMGTSFVVEIENIGRSPAFGVRIDGFLHFEHGTIEVAERRRVMRDVMRHEHSRTKGRMVPNGFKFSEQMSIMTSPGRVSSYLESFNQKSGRRSISLDEFLLAPCLVVTVMYELLFEGEVRVTEYALRVLAGGKEIGPGHGNIPVDSLSLGDDEHLCGGIYMT